MLFNMAGGKPIAFIATRDIGFFAAQALLHPTDQRYANRKIDLAAGEYVLDDVSRAIERAQGYTPWLARYAPKVLRNLLPHDFREMMKCEFGSSSLGSGVWGLGSWDLDQPTTKTDANTTRSLRKHRLPRRQRRAAEGDLPRPDRFRGLLQARQGKVGRVGRGRLERV